LTVFAGDEYWLTDVRNFNWISGRARNCWIADDSESVFPHRAILYLVSFEDVFAVKHALL
jgi:hypothetical protein